MYIYMQMTWLMHYKKGPEEFYEHESQQVAKNFDVNCNSQKMYIFSVTF